MITLEVLVVTVEGLQRETVERWVERDWIRPSGPPGAWLFSDIDVARLRLLRELHDDLDLHEEAVAVVLRLLDQLYDERRRLRRLRDAMESTIPAELQDAVLKALAARADA